MTAAFVPCPHCGAEIRRQATSCRYCGSSDEDGWGEEDSLDPGDDEFDYDAFVEREFSPSSQATDVKPLWRWTAALLLILVVWYLISALRATA